MNKFKKIFLLPVLFGAVVFVTGCSLFEKDDSASLAFFIDKAMVSKIRETASLTEISSRSASRALTDENDEFFLDLSLKGGYEAEKTLPVTEGATATFSDIPVGTSVYVSGVAYRLQTEGEKEVKTLYYAGESEKITIHAGDNSVSLRLKKMGSLSVQITVDSSENDIALSYTVDGTDIVFTATGSETLASTSVYAWYVDGNRQEENTSSFTLTTEGMTAGTYEIGVACGTKSASATIKIE